MDQFGISEDHERVFVLCCLMMAEEEAYANMPIKRLLEVYKSILEKRYLLLVNGGDIDAIVMWQNFDESLSEMLITEKRLPRINEIADSGHGVALTAVFGKTNRSVVKLLRHFFTVHMTNQTVLYERHYQNKKKQSLKSFKARINGRFV